MKNIQISLPQFIYLIVGLQFGINTFSAPALLAQEASTDGWISLLASGVIATITSILAVKLVARQPRKTFYQFLLYYFGPFFGRVVVLLLSAYWLYVLATMFLYTVHITQAWILPKTPNYSITLLFLVPTYMILRFGMRSLSRYSEVTFYLTVGLVLFVFIPLKESNIAFLLPVYKEGIIPILSGMKTGLFLFSGFEMAMLLYPYLNEKERAVKGVIIANALTTVIFLILILVCDVFYSPDEIQDYIWPSLNLFKVMEFPFIERFEIIFISYFLLVISSAILPYGFAAAWAISRILKIIRYHTVILVLVLSFGMISFFYSPSYYELEDMYTWSQPLSLIFSYAFPIFLLCYAILVDRLRRKHAKSH